MAARSRFRRVGKWVGLCACVLIAAIWAVSVRSYFLFNSLDFKCMPTIVVEYGIVSANWTDGPPAWCEQMRRDKVHLRNGTRYWDFGGFGQNASRLNFYRPGLWRAAPTHRIGLALPRIGSTPTLMPALNHRWAYLPIWLLFLLTAAPTALLWYRDRRRIPPGHCPKCGYNLTLNVSGTCPECGVAIHRQPSSPTAPGPNHA